MIQFIASIQRRVKAEGVGHSPLSSLVSPRRAFTLVELLVSITIIGILAGMAMAALQAAQQAAREASTRATIAKINQFIMAKYESYRNRRVPLTQTQMNAIAIARGWVADDPVTAIRRVRLNAIRDLMRLEMPDGWCDIMLNPATATPLAPGYRTLVIPTVPALTQQYFRRFINSPAPYATRNQNAPAKCLYMIVMSDPEAASSFRDDEIGEPDGDGLRVFLDAWGRPIRFIRWPAGFVDHANLRVHNGGADPAGAPGGQPLDWGSSPSDLQSGESVRQPDPFDTSDVMRRLVTRNAAPLPAHYLGYAMFPLIYSAGRDGIGDIYLGSEPTGGGPCLYAPTAYAGINPFNRDELETSADATGLQYRYVGQPMDVGLDGTLNHYDNIHNHRQEGL